MSWNYPPNQYSNSSGDQYFLLPAGARTLSTLLAQPKSASLTCKSTMEVWNLISTQRGKEDLFSPSPCSNKSDPCVVAFLASPRSPRQSKLLFFMKSGIPRPGNPRRSKFISRPFQPTKDCRVRGTSKITNRGPATWNFFGKWFLSQFIKLPWFKIPLLMQGSPYIFKKTCFFFDLGSLLEIVVLTRLATKSSSQKGEIPDLVQLRVIWIQGGPLPVIK